MNWKTSLPRIYADEREFKHPEITEKNRATEIEVGLLSNFGPEPQFRRFVFGNERKQIRVSPR
jgi:hypothetical protein